MKYKYYLSGADIVYAVDENGKIYVVTPEGKQPSSIKFIDPMWGGLAESEVKDYL